MTTWEIKLLYILQWVRNIFKTRDQLLLMARCCAAGHAFIHHLLIRVKHSVLMIGQRNLGLQLHGAFATMIAEKWSAW